MKTFSNFKFHMYTDVLFGKGTEMEVANMIKKHGGTKVMFGDSGVCNFFIPGEKLKNRDFSDILYTWDCS